MDPADADAALRLARNGVIVNLAPSVTAHGAYDGDGVRHVTIPPVSWAGAARR